MTNEQAFTILEDAIYHLPASETDAINILTQAYMFIGPYGQIPSWYRQPTFVDVSTITEYGLTQKLSNSIRVF